MSKADAQFIALMSLIIYTNAEQPTITHGLFTAVTLLIAMVLTTKSVLLGKLNSE